MYQLVITIITYYSHIVKHFCGFAIKIPAVHFSAQREAVFVKLSIESVAEFLYHEEYRACNYYHRNADYYEYQRAGLAARLFSL